MLNGDVGFNQLNTEKRHAGGVIGQATWIFRHT
jgi:hypothetical protein